MLPCPLNSALFRELATVAVSRMLGERGGERSSLKDADAAG